MVGIIQRRSSNVFISTWTCLGLHNAASAERFGDIICWNSTGDGFDIYNVNRLKDEVIPKIFPDDSLYTFVYDQTVRIREGNTKCAQELTRELHPMKILLILIFI